MQQLTGAVSKRSSTVADRSLADPSSATSTTQPIRPVLWWATVGVGFVILALYVQGRWLLGGQAHHVGTGVTPVPTYARISVRANEIVFGGGTLACFYIFVVREKLRTGRVGFYGLLYLSLFFVWWQDAITNYLSAGFAWNSEFLNLGGWGQNIPGWASPNPQASTLPIIWDLGFYLFASFVLLVLASTLLRRAQARWPGVKLPVLLGIYFLALLVASFAMEFFWVVSGCYAYGGTVRSWTLFAGHYYQFPLYESLFAAAVFFGWTCLIHFRNDRGETFLERGLDRLTFGHRQKQLVRFLALVAGLNLAYLLCYFIPINLFQNRAGLWPEDLQKRSYLVHGLCGQGTDVLCGNSRLRIGPDGKVVMPDGARLPQPVPFDR